MNNDWRDYELYHHGILGQKWGKLNGPPYPLDSKDHSASEKKAGWRQSLKNGIKKKVNEKLDEEDKKARDRLKEEMTPEWKKRHQNQPWNEKPTKKQQALAELSDQQKKAIKIGATSAAAVIAVIGAKKLIDINNEVKAEVAQKAYEEAVRLQKEQLAAWRASSPISGGGWARANANADKILKNLGY